LVAKKDTKENDAAALAATQSIVGRCDSTWNPKYFIDMPPHTNKTTAALKPASSWTYSWNNVNANTVGDWCFVRTWMPLSFKGGLIITYNLKNKDT
jgi:hypothetical protein